MLSSVITLIKVRGDTEKRNPPTAIHRGHSLSKAYPAIGSKNIGMIHERNINTARVESQRKVSLMNNGIVLSKLMMTSEKVNPTPIAART